MTPSERALSKFLQSVHYLDEYKAPSINTLSRSWDEDETEIRKLVVGYGVPHEIANELIGKTEDETDANIAAFISMLEREQRQHPRAEPPPPPNYYGIPYGHDRIDGVLVSNAAEQATIMYMVDLLDDGRDVNEIARALNESGIPTKSRKGKWKGSVVKNILARLGHIE